MTSPSIPLRALFDLARTLPRPARVGAALFFLAGLADGMLMPFFALWAQREAGVPTGYIGLLLGCYAGVELLATPLIGGIADRLGRRPVLLASTAGSQTPEPIGHSEAPFRSSGDRRSRGRCLGLCR